MMIRGAAVALALVLFQDPELGRLAEQLGNEDPSQRQQAERRLLEIGEPARSELERLARSKDAEVSGRARAILTTLDRAAVRRKYLGPPWTVTLAEGDYLLGDLPGLLKTQVPAALQIPEKLAGSHLRIGAKEMPVWSFLDRVCESHGGLTVPLERPEGAFALVEGKPAGAPTSYSGPFRIWIERLTFEEGEKWRGCRLVYGITWQPNVDPSNEGMFSSLSFHLRELTDAAGKELKIERDHRRFGSGFTLDHDRKGVYRHYLDLAAPPAGVRRWGKMKGGVTMEFPAKVTQVEFKAPTHAVGTTFQAGSTAITLTGYRQIEGGIQARLYFRRTWKPEDAEVERNRLELRARFRDESVVLRGADGTDAVLEVRSSSHSSSDEEETYEILGFFKTGQDGRLVRFPFVAETFEHEAPFEFTNVDVP